MIIAKKDDNGCQLPFEMLYQEESKKYKNTIKVGDFLDKKKRKCSIILEISDYEFGYFSKLDLYVNKVDYGSTRLTLGLFKKSNEATLKYFWVHPDYRKVWHGIHLLNSLELIIKMYNLKIQFHNIQLAHYFNQTNSIHKYPGISTIDRIKLQASAYEEGVNKGLVQSELVSLYKYAGFRALDDSDTPEMIKILW